MLQTAYWLIWPKFEYPKKYHNLIVEICRNVANCLLTKITKMLISKKMQAWCFDPSRTFIKGLYHSAIDKGPAFIIIHILVILVSK